MEQPNIAAPTGANVTAPVIDTADEQFFDSIIGSPTVTPVSPAMGNQAPPVNAAPASEDKSKERFEYWQGQADRYRQELEKVQPLASEYTRFQPVVEYLKQNPDAIDKIAAMRGTGNTLSQDTIQAPAKPVRPTDYNDSDAVTPGTASFKYDRAVNDYRTQLTEYMYAKQELQEKKQMEYSQKEQAKQIESQRISELGNTLVAQYGFNKDQVADFVQVMNSPESMEMKNLVNLYKVIKHNTKNVATARRDTTTGANMPPPPIGSGGNFEPPVSEEDSFFGDIASFGKPSNPLMRIPAN